MLDLGWSEMAIIAALALFVIGPKDLPKALRTLGHYGGKVRGLAREFRSSIDDAMREAELDEVTKQIQSATNMDLDTALDATERLADSGDDSDSHRNIENQVEPTTANQSPPLVNKHFARFGEHYTRSGADQSADESSVASSVEDDVKPTSTVSSSSDLPTGVAQVVKARERGEAGLQGESDEVQKTGPAVPDRQAES